MSGGVDRLGDGKLLPKAIEAIDRVFKGSGWIHEWDHEIKDGFYGKVQGWLMYAESGDGARKYDVPVIAKRYVLNRQGRLWWSVSKRLHEEATSDLMLTYIDEFGQVYVASHKAAVADAGDIRFGDTYFGWYMEDAIELGKWLRSPEDFTVQSAL